MIHNGILIVIYYNKLVVRLYDIVNVILQNCMIEHLRIGEKYRDCQDLIVGQSPLGLPVNVKLEKQPPLLYNYNFSLREVQNYFIY